MMFIAVEKKSGTELHGERYAADIVQDFTQSFLNDDFKSTYGEPDIQLSASAQALVLKAEESTKKMAGVKFEEVMCSATVRDQDGLSAMLVRYLACKLSNKPFIPVNFEFANGNSLVLTADNIEDLQATWEPFRSQFFPVPEVA